MAQKYRKIDPRIWSDEGFATLSVPERLVALYLLTTSQGNRIGIFRFSPASAAEDLEMPPDAFLACFERVLKAFHWKWDRKFRVLFIPTWWKYNTPLNQNAFKSCLADLHDLPNCSLRDEFLQNNLYLNKWQADELAAAAENYSTGRSMGKGRSRRATHDSAKVAANNAPNDAGNIAPNVAGNVTSNIGLNVRPQEQEQEQDKEVEQKDPALSFPPSLDTPEFRQTWKEWLEYCRNSNIATNQATREAQLKKLSDLDADSAIACLRRSIQKRWRSVYPGEAAQRKHRLPQNGAYPVGPGLRYQPPVTVEARHG